jgi:hypothetical protein
MVVVVAYAPHSMAVGCEWVVVAPAVRRYVYLPFFTPTGSIA